MKIRRSVFLLVLVSAALIVLIIWFGKEPAKVPLPAGAETNTGPASMQRAATEPTQRESSSTARTDVHVGQTATTASVPAPPSVQSKDQQMREGLSELNEVDIEFYGRLEDQFGDAVGNAQVKFEIPFNDGDDVGVRRGATAADSDGFFAISGYNGKSLSVVPVKPGYVLASTNGGGIYSHLWPESERAHPERNNPTVIKMWKLQGAQRLVDIGKDYRLPFNGSPIFFDLATGKIVPAGGDLEVIVTRAEGSLSKRNPGDWSLELKPVNGGIVESDYQTAQFTFEAPADGYRDGYIFRMSGVDPSWHDGIDKEFFLKSRGGEVYSKLYLVFGINRAPGDSLYFQFRGVANTNRSRNWETAAPR